MNIGIIGAGHIGAILARKFAEAGHAVRIANSRGPQSLEVLAEKLGVTAVRLDAVAEGAEALVVSIPFGRVPDLSRALFATLPAHAPVIDTGNYYPNLRDPVIAALEPGSPDGLTESEWVAGQIGRPVIKAFNSIIAPSLAEDGRPSGDPRRIALPVAGDDAKAKRTALALVDDAGFDALDAGRLAESWRQQPGARAYCTDLSLDALRQALAAADRAGAPAKRDAALAKLKQSPMAFTKEEIIRVNRETFSGR